MTIFEKPADYAAFLRVLEETWELVPLPIFAMVAMPNHGHFVVWPTSDDQVREFFRRLNKAETEAEVQTFRSCIQRGLPFGDDRWTKSSVVRLDLHSTTRPRGRPRKESS